MTTEPSSTGNRREFLTGKALRSAVERAGEALADELTAGVEVPTVPTAGHTVRLSTRAMACDFSVIMNPGPGEQVMIASEALDLLHPLEDQMSVYRDDSELSLLNGRAAEGAVEDEPELFALLRQSCRLCVETDGCFDPTSGLLIRLWSRCRDEATIPSAADIAQTLLQTGVEQVVFDEPAHTIRFKRDGVQLNLGGIGKGYALDRAGRRLSENGIDDWLFHGGYSSILARGDHNGLGGWPVGVMNPLFPRQRFATILLQDRAMSTSGSSIQYFRHGGRRFGHILDPRTGWPVEDALSVTVLAPTAAQADALSTAFFVMGVEKAQAYCDNDPSVSAILFPPPRHGRTLEPIVCGISDEVLFSTSDDLG